jgi:hypothetical protein
MGGHCRILGNVDDSGSLNFFKQINGQSIGSCSREGIVAPNIPTNPCRKQQNTDDFLSCCVKRDSSDTPIVKPKWCKGVWKFKRYPSLKKMKSYGLPPAQKCYYNSSDGDYACNKFSGVCVDTAIAECPSIVDPIHGLTGTWGADLYFHTKLFKKFIPLDLLTPENWNYRDTAGNYLPKQYDIEFVIERSVFLSEGSSNTLAVKREGGFDGQALAYVKPMPNKSTVMEIRQNTHYAEQGEDWDFLPGDGDNYNFVTINNFTEKATHLVEISARELQLNDVELEVPDESVSLEITNPVFARIGQTGSKVVLTVLDDGDKGFIEFSSGQLYISEAEKMGNVSVFITKRGFSGECNVTVETFDGTAKQVSDYVYLKTVVTIPPDRSNATFSVEVLLDTIFESPDEYLLLRLTDAYCDFRGERIDLPMENANFATSKLYIKDDADAGKFSFSSGHYFVDEDSDFMYTFTVTRTGYDLTTKSADVTLRFSTLDRTANQSDYSPVVSEFLYFQSTDTFKEVQISLKNDDLFEYPNEEFILQLHDIEYEGTPQPVSYGEFSNATVVILDDGDFGFISFERKLDERELVDGVEVAKLSLFEDSERDVVVYRHGRSSFGTNMRVAYKTVQQTALSHLDFISMEGRLEFNRSVNNQTLRISSKSDSIFEYPDEYFDIVLHSVEYDVTGNGNWTMLDTGPLQRNITSLYEPYKAILTILDDGDSGTLGFAMPTLNITESEESSVFATVYRSGSLSTKLSVEIQSVDNVDLSERQTLFCKADRGKFNITFRGNVLSVGALENDASALQQRIQTVLNITVNVKLNQATVCTASGALTYFDFTGENTRGDVEALVVTPDVDANALTRQRIHEVQNIRCIADSGSFRVWFLSEVNAVTVSYSEASTATIESALEGLDGIDDVSVTFSKNGASACSVDGSTEISVTFTHFKQSGDVPFLRIGPSFGENELRLEAFREKHQVNCTAESGKLILSFSNPFLATDFFAKYPYKTKSPYGSKCSSKSLGSKACATCLSGGQHCERPSSSNGPRHPHLCIDSSVSKSTCYNG